jgi:ribonuclease VapC
MIVDSSALVAILLVEAEAVRLSHKLAAAERVIVPAHVLLEAGMVLGSRLGREGLDRLDRYVAELGPEVLAFTEAHARLARAAFLAFGKGLHPAGLNFGDCMSYAVAKAEGMPLLFVGDDFARTDIPAA